MICENQTLDYVMSHSDFKMDPKMTVGPVTLLVRDIDTMQRFYSDDMGLKKIRVNGEVTELGIGENKVLLKLKNKPSADVPPAGSAGLYHFAILQPDRRSLAEAYLALGNRGITFDGYADHLVSEALYLTDPEGNGIEIYSDRDRKDWKLDEEGAPQMGTYPLDIQSLLLEAKGSTNLRAVSDKTRMGHVHLKVTDLKRSMHFYQAQLGFDLMNYWGSAAFLSAGRYHHHVGMNTWESLSGTSLNNDCAGLESFTLCLSKDAENQLRSHLKVSNEDGEILDPDGIRILLAPQA